MDWCVGVKSSYEASSSGLRVGRRFLGFDPTNRRTDARHVRAAQPQTEGIGDDLQWGWVNVKLLYLATVHYKHFF